MNLLVSSINLAGQLLMLVVIIWVLLSYFVSPYHPVRQAFDRFVEPLLAPIRRVVPPLGNIDFSPMVLIILIQMVVYLVISLLL